MTDTVTVNSLSVSHLGSGGVSTATIPDVCKTPTPGGPVPMPYPNISVSNTLSDGTKTVSADGGNMIAIKDSKYATSSGDEPGTAGGVTSSTFKQESTWITYSFDVQFDGSNVCRLTDKKFHNHKNTVNLAGDLEPANLAKTLNKMACECVDKVKKDAVFKNKEFDDKPDEVKCLILGSFRHSCVSKKLKDAGGPAEGVHSPAGANYDSGELPKGKNYCRPDVVVTAPGVTPPPEAPDMKKIYDLKFQCCDKKDLKPKSEWGPDKQWGKGQKECYKHIKTFDGEEKKGGVPVEAVGPTKDSCK